MNLGKSLKIESVSRLNPTPALQLPSHQPVSDAIVLLRNHGVGCLLVSDDDRVVGIFTERDLLRRILAQGASLSLPMSECMTPKPTTVNAKESISAAIQRMFAGGYRHLPVVNDAGKAEGVLSVKRIVHYIVEHFPGTVYNLPPQPNSSPEQREGA